MANILRNECNVKRCWYRMKYADDNSSASQGFTLSGAFVVNACNVAATQEFNSGSEVDCPVAQHLDHRSSIDMEREFKSLSKPHSKEFEEMRQNDWTLYSVTGCTEKRTTCVDSFDYTILSP
eukprot:scaffold7330_cov146-Cylindrotheca_fusiformis.AAC.9